MNKIQSQLIRPFVEKMEKEWQALYEKVCGSDSKESAGLKPEVESQLMRVKEMLKEPDLSVSAAAHSDEAVHSFLRQSKMELRSAERRWQRHLVSMERVKTRAMNHSAKFPSSSERPQH